MSPQELGEALRELARRISGQFPSGLFYCLVVWPPGQPTDTGYFSNAHRAEAMIAIREVLLRTGGPTPRLTQAEREILEAAGCGWVLERLER